MFLDQYGADTLRLYEMFLGPLEDSKPWSTKGIDGTYRFLKKLWALFYDQDGTQLSGHDSYCKQGLHENLAQNHQENYRRYQMPCLSIPL